MIQYRFQLRSAKFAIVYSFETQFTNEFSTRLSFLTTRGAYRLVSGDDWLVLIGEDSEFAPIEPWARNNSDIVSGRAQQEWQRITGSSWDC